MSDQSIFNSGTPAPEVVPVVTPPTPSITLPPEVAEYVGTGKKYATVDDAIKSVPHAQKHITTLQEELAVAKAELEKRRTTEAILEELKLSGNTQVQTQSVPTITQEEVQNLVNQTIGLQQVKARESSNEAIVINGLTSKFGNQAEEEYKRIAKESGLSIQDLNNLSKRSPTAVLKLAGIENKKVDPVVPKPNSTINTEAFNSNKQDTTLSARVKPGASTKDLVSAWKIAGQKVGRNYS